MPGLQSSGAISLSDLATEFGDTAPYSMSEYYRDGGKVPGNNTGVPTSGAIGLGHFYGAIAALVLDITSNTSNVNILTLATAAGYNAATDTTPIIVNVAAGVEITGSGTYAMRTGALNADSDLTINVASTAFITGYTGTQGATGGSCSNGSPGTAGGDSIYFETATGGSGTYAVVNSGTIRSGGGGGGGGGGGSTYGDSQGKSGCDVRYAPAGSPGANGGYGQNGQNGSAGSNTTGGCFYCSAGSGGAGGAAGYAVRKNGRTVTTSGAGTYTGATA